MSISFTMGERVPTPDLIHHIAHLLRRFADADHPALNQAEFAPHHYQKTGVLVRSEWSDNPALILFCFFATGRKGTPSEVNHLVSVEFDIRDFHCRPTEYVSNMIKRVATDVDKAAKKTLEAAQNNTPQPGNLATLPTEPH